MTNIIEQVINDAMQREADALEHMCEVALTTPGSPGISVQRTFKCRGEHTVTTVTKLDPDVPFGEIHYLQDIHECP